MSQQKFLPLLVFLLLGVPFSPEFPALAFPSSDSGEGASVPVSERTLVVFQSEGELESVKAGDLNGDGRTDLFTRRKGAETILVALIDEKGIFHREEWQGFRPTLDWSDLLVGDVNGDRTTELVSFDRESRRFSLLIPRQGGRFDEIRSPTSAPKFRKIVPILDGKIQSHFLMSTSEGRYHYYEASTVGESGSIRSLGIRAYDPNWDLFALASPERGLERDMYAIHRREPDMLLVAYGRNTDPFAEMNGAYFPGEMGAEWKEILFGDFNGDGKRDVFARHSGLGGWWIGYGVEGSFIEKPLSGLSSEARTAPTVLVGDFDGDGSDELLSFDIRRGIYRLVIPRRSVRLSGEPLCTGYLAQGGILQKWGRIVGSSCPSGYAVLETVNSRKLAEGMKNWPFYPMLCCKLPDSDIIGSRQQIAGNLCPAESVVTGRRCESPAPACEEFLECGRVNTERYQLGEPREGQQWGFYWSIDQPLKLQRTELPPAIRDGAGRLSYDLWDIRGCIGSPPGALLSGIGEECTGSQFRELQYRGRPGDPPAGTPVKMFPDCNRIENVFDTTPRCAE